MTMISQIIINLLLLNKTKVIQQQIVFKMKITLKSFNKIMKERMITQEKYVFNHSKVIKQI